MLKLPFLGAAAIALATLLVAICHHHQQRKQHHQHHPFLPLQLFHNKTVIAPAPEPPFVDFEMVMGFEFPNYAYTADRGCGAVVIHDDVLLASASCQGAFLSSSIIIEDDEDTSFHLAQSEHLVADITGGGGDDDDDDNNDPNYYFMIVILEAPTTSRQAKIEAVDVPPKNLSIVGMNISFEEGLTAYQGLLTKATVQQIPCNNHTTAEPTNETIIDPNKFWCASPKACDILGGPVFIDEAETVGGFVHSCNEHDKVVMARLTNANAILQKLCEFSATKKPDYCSMFEMPKVREPNKGNTPKGDRGLQKVSKK